MTGENELPACECYTVLDTRKDRDPPACDVCDQPAATHQNLGRRVLSGGEIEAIRRQMIVDRFALREAEQPRSNTDGQA